MIEDAKYIPPKSQLTCDIAIIGAGAAGITLGLELAETGLDVLLLEAGGLKQAGKSQELYKGELLDPERHLPLDSDRYRQLGGTTSLWGGRCLPYNAIDFEQRDYVPYSGWPFGLEELSTYYRQAAEYCECGSYKYQVEDALPGCQSSMIPGFQSNEFTTNTIERWSPPTNFGKRYHQDLCDSKSVRVLLNAICHSIKLSDDGISVKLIRVSTYFGNTFTITPRYTVIAGGGLESTRLLMASHGSNGQGIGDHSDWLGRGYMCHVNGVAAKVRFNPGLDVVFGYEKDPDGVYCRRRLWLSEDAQRKHGLLNSYLLLDRPMTADPDHGNALLSLAYLAKRMTSSALTPLAGRGKYGIYVSHIRNILKGAPSMFMALPKWSRDRFLQGRRIPSMVTTNKDNVYYIYYHSEQVPDRSSRITLSDKCDQFGMPRLRVDYRYTDADVDSIYRTHKLLQEELHNSKCGELSFLEPDPREEIARHQATLGHHIGTTRMSRDPKNGVVNEHCRVHGIENLFVVSSSVFPTSSQANPVMTIVALAVRLAGHLVQMNKLNASKIA